MRAEQVTAPESTHGEGAVWWGPWGLCWLDMLEGDVLRLDASGAVERWDVAGVVAAVRPRHSGGVVIASEREFMLSDEFGGTPRSVATVVTDPDLRFNEGGCDPDGRFWCGTMSYSDRAGASKLYRLETNFGVVEVVDHVTTSNGLAWSPDGRTAYYVDTATSRVDTFTYDVAGGLQGRRTLVEIDPRDGLPDGLTTDAEGGIWVALWEGAAVRRYDDRGRLTEVVDIPVSKVTSCTFGGSDLTELFVTTSRHQEANPAPGAGAVFRVNTGTVGLPTRTFAA